MSHKIFEIYRKILRIEHLDICNIHTDGGVLFLEYDNTIFNELLKRIIESKRLVFDCIRKDKKFFIINIKRNTIKGFEATIIDIEKEKYTENVHIITDPFRVLILNKNYTNHDNLYNKLKIGNTYLFLSSTNCNQLLDVKKPLQYTNYIEVADIITPVNNEYTNYVEIKVKNSNVRFFYDSLLNIGNKYRITYSKSFGGNLYKIINSEIMT